MGQAKRRGTFEQRKAAAIKHNAERIRKCKLAGITKRQLMTSEEREKERRATELLTMMSALKTGTEVMLYKI